MPQYGARSYTADHVIADDGTVGFACSTDAQEWGWLTLTPHHPAVIQTQNFWTSVGAIEALGGMEKGQWSALTWTDWDCGDTDVGHAVRGIYARTHIDDHESYTIDLFDADDQRIVTMRGRGVVFRNRNFEEWRSKAKQEASQAADAGVFEFAPPDALGLSDIEHPLVAPLQQSAADTIEGLVTRENGLPPYNPVLGGSGDHVNSTHIVEAARQALCLIEGRADIYVSGGEMTLKRYVELGTPFRLQTSAREQGKITLVLEQLNRACSEITLRW